LTFPLSSVTGAISSLQKRPRGTTHARDPFLSNANRFFLEHATSLPSCIIRGGKSVCFTGALSAVTSKKGGRFMQSYQNI
jgi:hypothetical protein